MKKTQIEWVKERLRANGKISRNECLQNCISRLGAIIQRLEGQGWVFFPSSEDGDYVYSLQDRPKPPTTYVKNPLTGATITTEEYAKL